MKTTLLAVVTALGLIGQASAAINTTHTKNFGDGLFGGSLTTTLSDTNSATAYTLAGSSVAKATVLGTKSTVATANASVTVRPDSTGQIKGKLVVKGVVRVDFTRDFTASLEFNAGSFSNTWNTGLKTLTIAGINLRFAGRVSVTTTAKAKAVVSTPLHVEAIITPTFDASATTTFSTNMSGVTGGTKGKISLFTAKLPISAVLTPNVVLVDGQLSINGSKVTVLVTLSGTNTKGTITGFFTVGGRTTNFTIASYNGLPFGPITLASGTFILQ